MVVAFQDGSITLYDTWKQLAVKTVHTHCYHMACSPDGQTLVTDCDDGRLFLWDFKTLSIEYVINTHEAMSKALAFTQCGTRIIDLQARKAKVWEPPVLIHRVDDSDSDTNTPAALPSVTDYLVTIISTCIRPRKDIIFVGKDDGTLSIYSAVTGEPQSILYSHRQDMFIHKIASNTGNVVASDDASNTVMVYEFEERSGLPYSIKQLLNHRFDLPVQ
jgi:WD40 repeat protein